MKNKNGILVLLTGLLLPLWGCGAPSRTEVPKCGTGEGTVKVDAKVGYDLTNAKVFDNPSNILAYLNANQKSLGREMKNDLYEGANNIIEAIDITCQTLTGGIALTSVGEKLQAEASRILAQV